MNKYLRKSLYIGLSALMVAGLGASLNNAYASINPDNYGIDVFPSKKTHNKFAYQLRRRGHNSRVYYATKNSKIGRAIFGNGNPNIDYANYMDRYHHGWYNYIINKLEGRKAQPKRRARVPKRVRKTTNKRRAKKVQKHTRKTTSKRRVTKRAKNNKKQTKLVKRYNRKARVNHKRIAKRAKKAKQSNNNGLKIFKARYTRSNNKRLLKRSGFEDAKNDPKQLRGATFIFNKYAPNDKRAVVPKNFKPKAYNVLTNTGTRWYQGKPGLNQKAPVEYVYLSSVHGWVK